MMEFYGYRRENGQIGIRNWVGIMSAMDNCNPVTRRICASVAGTLPITTLFGRAQIGSDLEVTLRTLSGLGNNPNIASVVLVGLEEKSTNRLAERIRASGKRVATVNIMPHGTVEAVAQGTRAALALVVEASKKRRVACSLSALTIGVECGGSDTTSGLSCNPAIGVVSDRIVAENGTVIISETSEFFGAEHLFADRAVDAAVKQQFLECVLGHERNAIAQGVDIRGEQPSADNIRGGLTTIEEKALGAMAKAGSSALVGVLQYGEAPRRNGLHFMTTPAPAVESMTALAAAGCQMILFGTGVGNPIGSMVSPTVKITGNVNTLKTMPENQDFDVSAILETGASVGASGDRLMNFVIDVASGTKTVSEILDIRETAISRFGPTL